MNVTEDLIQHLESSGISSVSSEESAKIRKNAGACDTTGVNATLLKNKENVFVISILHNSIVGGFSV